MVTCSYSTLISRHLPKAVHREGHVNTKSGCIYPKGKVSPSLSTTSVGGSVVTAQNRNPSGLTKHCPCSISPSRNMTLQRGFLAGVNSFFPPSCSSLDVTTAQIYRDCEHRSLHIYIHALATFCGISYIETNGGLM